MVQGWYQGGVSVFDFTDSTNPVEIAYFDRGPLDAEEPDHRRLLVDLLVQRQPLRLGDRARHGHLQAGADAVPVAERDRRRHPVARRPSSTRRTSRGQVAEPTTAVAKAYLDQLNRTKGISAERAKAVTDSLAKVDELRTGKERNAAAPLDALERRRGAGRSRCEVEDRPRRDAAASSC